MINIQSDLLPLSPSVLDKCNWKTLKRIAAEGNSEQKELLLSWSYSGCTSAMSEELYEIAQVPYPFNW